MANIQINGNSIMTGSHQSISSYSTQTSIQTANTEGTTFNNNSTNYSTTNNRALSSRSCISTIKLFIFKIKSCLRRTQVFFVSLLIACTHRYPNIVLCLINKLGGMFLKMAQFILGNQGMLRAIIPTIPRNLLSDYERTFRTTLTENPTALSHHQVQECLREENIQCEYIEPEPVGVGTIAQVNIIQRPVEDREDGENYVAAKILKPGIREQYLIDKAVILWICDIIHFIKPELMTEHSRRLIEMHADQLIRECDFLNERANIDLQAETFDTLKTIKDNFIPDAELGLTIAGINIFDTEQEESSSAETESLFTDNADEPIQLNEASSRFTEDEINQLPDLQFHDSVHALEHGSTQKVLLMHKVEGVTMETEEARDILLRSRNLRKSDALREASDVMHATMKAGLNFQADRHTGNLMVTPEGKIVVIDCGNHERIDNYEQLESLYNIKEQQRQLAGEIYYQTRYYSNTETLRNDCCSVTIAQNKQRRFAKLSLQTSEIDHQG